MKRNKYLKLKRNFLVRFIRWASRCLTNLLKPRKSNSSAVDRQHISDLKIDRSELLAREEALVNEQLITVGELFGRVKWQSLEQDNQKEIFNFRKVSKPDDASMN
jgi:hypothetical protein